MAIVTCTKLDAVRIEVLGEGRAVTIPASLILAVDKVLRAALVREVALDVEMVEENRQKGWQACLEQGEDLAGEMAATPWGAVAALAEEIQ